MAAERSTAPAAQPAPLPLPPRLSASSSSPATVGALLTKAASGAPRECRSPRSLLSRILGRVGGGGGGGGFGCRLRLPRYCSSGAAAKEDAGEEEEVAGPKVVGGRLEVRESPRSSLQGNKEAAAAVAAEVSPASLGLGASLVLLLSKGAAELSRMAELRAQMERLVLDVKADARGSNRSNACDSASVVKEPIVFADDEDADDPRSAASACAAGGNAGRRADAAAAAMDHMEAELEAELTRLQFASNDEDSAATPRRDHQLETEAKSDVSSESGSPARIDIDNDSVIDDGASAQGCEEDDDGTEEEERPPHGGVPARELERRLHELLQSRHEERIAELESELQRARRKLQEKEREVSRWRDTAKLVSRHKDESRLR